MGRTDQHVALPDGRRLAFAEYGDPDGPPVFLFHGFPGSRLDGKLGEPAALANGVRVIATDRPGYGRSDFQQGRRIPDWPADVSRLADHLGLDRFAVMGISGGGPYAAACARLIPERLTRVALVCGVAPFDHPGARRDMHRLNRAVFGLAQRAPWLLSALARPVVKRLLRDPERMVDRTGSQVPEIDREVMARPQIREALFASVREAVRQGPDTLTQEALLYARPWGFALEEIDIEVLLFQGEIDRNVPVSMGRHQATAIPKCRAWFYPDDGHLSLAIDRAPEIIRRLTE